MAWNFGLLGAAAGGAGGPAYDHIETVTPTGTSVEFTGLGSLTDYKHLQIRFVGHQSGGVNTSPMNMQFNNVTSGVYAYHRLYGYLAGSGVQSEAVSGASSIPVTQIVGNAQSSQNFSGGIIDILDFADTNKKTTVRILDSYADDNNSDGNMSLRSGLFNSTDAITSIKFPAIYSSFTSGSRFSLFGVK